MAKLKISFAINTLTYSTTFQDIGDFMNTLTPKEIVSELDRFVIGQNEAKRMVAVAMRNRWRRQLLEESLREEIAPKNIIMIGPTGVGKTEIAKRLAKLCASPFIKIEATKYTEVGYVGRDVESMIRDLMEIAVRMVKEEENNKMQPKAEHQAEERLLDILLPESKHRLQPDSDKNNKKSAEFTDLQNYTQNSSDNQDTREKLRNMWRQGFLNDREVEMELETHSGPQLEILTMPGMEDMGSQFQDMFNKIIPSRRKRKRIKVAEAYPILLEEESDRLIDFDKVVTQAIERVEQTGIIFIDEMDKIASGNQNQRADVSREGVQRDLLPIVEGSTVKTKYGMVKTDHILFIAAGAFHFSKPSDLIPELQGRFPLRVELTALDQNDFYRILTEPSNALTKQYIALLSTEGVHIEFTDDALKEIAIVAENTNRNMENIGARRLYTILEKILAELSFAAPDSAGETIVIDKEYVNKHLDSVLNSKDLTRYIL